MPSFIRSLLLTEAPEELTVPEVRGEVPAGDAISADDFSEPEMPEPIAGAAPMSTSINAPSMPSNMTIQKEVLNKELIKAVTSEMKALVSTFEKQFDKDDMNVGDAEIHITNFLQSLAFQAEKLSTITGSHMSEVPGPGVAMEEPVAPAPVIPEEELPTTEPTMETPVEEIPGQEMFTAPEGEPEVPEFTSPTEVI